MENIKHFGDYLSCKIDFVAFLILKNGGISFILKKINNPLKAQYTQFYVTAAFIE